MYTIRKRFEISGSHQLNLNYDSKCNNLHGHNWIVYVTCKNEKLDENGMVIDFAHIKEVLKQLDHIHLNNVICQPTAENMARWVYDHVPFCIKVEVQESEGNIAIYET